MKKRMISCVTALLLTSSLLLTSCNSNSDSSSGSNSGGADETITINFWHSMKSGTNFEAVKTMVQEFNDTNTQNIVVKQTPQGDYNECSAKLQQAIAAKNAPEVCMLDRGLIPQYAPLNVLEDMKPYCDKDNVDLDDFVEGLMVFSYVDDKLVSLPFNRSTPIFYWNKNAFEEAGLDPDTPPTTYDELMEYAKKLTKEENGKTTQYGFSMTVDAGWFLMGMVQQQGKRMLSEDGETVLFTEDGSGLKAMQYWKDLVDSGYYQIPATTDAGVTLLENFYQEKVAMMYASTGDLTAVIENTEGAGKFDVGTGYMMKFDTQSCPTGGANIVMLADKTDEQKAAAWEFMKFATSTDQAAKWSAATGYVPTRQSAVETDAIKTLWQEHPQYKVAFEQLQYANDTCYSPYFWEYNSMMNKIISTMVQDNKITAEEAIKQMEDEAALLFPGNK